jgi:transposase
MARYKDYNYNQSKLIPIRFSEQIIPGSFEHTVNYLIDHEIDLSVFNVWYKNDEYGAPAYDPALLLKIVLVAYSRGVTSSRRIEQLCRENIVFMALSADSQPHFTTIADFIARMGDVIRAIFTDVLLICNEEHLIGGDMFAIDGCKLPSNASKEWSGTRTDLDKKVKKMDRAVRRMLAKHREEDQSKHENDHDRRAREEKQIVTLRKTARKIRQFTKTMNDREGISGKVVKSNITDNESATMKTSKGTVQGYNGVAAVDSTHQVIVAAEAFGQGPENNLFEPLVEQIRDNLGNQWVEEAAVTADSGFHSQQTLAYCHEQQLNAYIADGNFRKRDPRFKERDRFQPKERQRQHFLAEDFTYDPDNGQCRCPAGKVMWCHGERERYGNHYLNFVGYLKDCRSCPLQKQCLRHPPTTRGRQVSINLGRTQDSEPHLINQMKEKIDTDQGRDIYSQRLGTVEPVFGNIGDTKGLDWFSLRGKWKVNAQWMMYCLVHNIEKLQHYSSIGRTSP